MLPLSQWPITAARKIRGVFTDIDDTLTTQGTITSEAREALAALHSAGICVIPITGRPIGWCRPFLDGVQGPALPVESMVAENGAVAFSYASRNGYTAWAPEATKQTGDLLVKHYQQDAASRMANRKRIAAVAARVMAEVPGVELSQDSMGRETDLAFDYAEFANHPPETVERVLRILQKAGMQTTVSSIHIHGCFGDFDKWQGARWILRELLNKDLVQELDRWVFVGDSGNDQPMFQNFVHSVGVANIAHVAPRLKHLPRYITQSARGAGFAEVAQAILAAR